MKAAVRLDCSRFAQNDVEPFGVTVDSSASTFFYAMTLQQGTKWFAKDSLVSPNKSNMATCSVTLHF